MDLPKWSPASQGRRRHSFASVLVLALLALPLANAAPLLDVNESFGPEPQSRNESFTFAPPDTDTGIAVVLNSKLDAGSLDVHILGPDGQELLSQSFEKGKNNVQTLLPARQSPGDVAVNVSALAAVGTWSIKAAVVPEGLALYSLLATGPLMMLIALAFAVGWYLRSRVQWRWFWLGAGLWAIAVAVKILWAVLVDTRLFPALDKALGHSSFIAVGALYVGLESAVCEMGAVLLLALFWRKIAAEGSRAVTIGVGAGAFEAFLLGVAGLTQMIVMTSGASGADTLQAAIGVQGAGTALLFLVGPVERILTILCHISSRTLLLLGVATRKPLYSLYGFLLFTGIDAIAGWALLSGFMKTHSVWWVELAILPFALISIPAIRWSLRRWPAPAPLFEPPPPEVPEPPRHLTL